MEVKPRPPRCELYLQDEQCVHPEVLKYYLCILVKGSLVLHSEAIPRCLLSASPVQMP